MYIPQLLSTFSVLCFFAVAHAAVNSTCDTPDHLSGTCQTILLCPSLMAILSKKIKTVAEIEYLRRSQCGKEYVEKIPVVCCPKETVPLISMKLNDKKSLINSDECGFANSERIFYGTTTYVAEFPWMALLNYGISGEDDFACGGTLINDRYVLTAAHCVHSSRMPTGVRLGEHDLRTAIDCDVPVPGDTIPPYCAPAPQNFNIEKIIKHDKFVLNIRKVANDIALIRLDRSVVMNDAVVPICLPDGSNLSKNLDGMKLVVTGWGRTENRTFSTSPVLMKVSVPVVPNNKCAEAETYAPSITENVLCAGGTNLKQDSCNGDSGGPIKALGRVGSSARYIQYGIVSFGSKNCGSQTHPGVYTRVSKYMDWILANIEQ